MSEDPQSRANARFLTHFLCSVVATAACFAFVFMTGQHLPDENGNPGSTTPGYLLFLLFGQLFFCAPFHIGTHRTMQVARIGWVTNDSHPRVYTAARFSFWLFAIPALVIGIRGLLENDGAL